MNIQTSQKRAVDMPVCYRSPLYESGGIRPYGIHRLAVFVYTMEAHSTEFSNNRLREFT